MDKSSKEKKTTHNIGYLNGHFQNAKYRSDDIYSDTGNYDVVDDSQDSDYELVEQKKVKNKEPKPKKRLKHDGHHIYIPTALLPDNFNENITKVPYNSSECIKMGSSHSIGSGHFCRFIKKLLSTKNDKFIDTKQFIKNLLNNFFEGGKVKNQKELSAFCCRFGIFINNLCCIHDLNRSTNDKEQAKDFITNSTLFDKKQDLLIIILKKEEEQILALKLKTPRKKKKEIEASIKKEKQTYDANIKTDDIPETHADSKILPDKIKIIVESLTLDMQIEAIIGLLDCNQKANCLSSASYSYQLVGDQLGRRSTCRR